MITSKYVWINNITQKLLYITRTNKNIIIFKKNIIYIQKIYHLFFTLWLESIIYIKKISFSLNKNIIYICKHPYKRPSNNIKSRNVYELD